MKEFSKFLALCFIFLVNFFNTTWAQSCSSSPCRPPSECENLGNDYICHCKGAVKGKQCAYPLLAGEDSCLSNPCWSGGTCTSVGTDFRCNCLPGYTGKNCRTIESSPCLFNNPCVNGNCQTIADNSGVVKPICICYGEYTGSNCDTPFAFCSKPCFNGGTCLNERCNCLANYTGDRCQTYNPPNKDKIVKIYSKAGYVSNLYLYYEVTDPTGIKHSVVQTGSIWALQDYGFRIPETVDYNSGIGATLVVDAVAGINVLTVRLQSNPECFHVWGTTTLPKWSRMPCWDRCC